MSAAWATRQISSVSEDRREDSPRRYPSPMPLPLLAACVLLQQPTQLQPIARVNHAAVSEMSGIVRSRRHGGIYWVHNDSGDSARIFAIGLDGKVVFGRGGTEESFEGIKIDGAKNVDWEDIAIDRDTLYIADMGNNGNARKNLGVYVVKEPNPRSVDRTKTLRFIPVAYPTQSEFPPKENWTYDCEAVFVFRGKLHFLTKHRRGPVMPEDSTVLWRLEKEQPGKVNPLRRLGSRKNLGGWVTAADVSPDGKTLAVLCNAPRAAVWLFSLTKSEDLLSGPARMLPISNVNQAEAICWENASTLIITNEQIFRLPVAK